MSTSLENALDLDLPVKRRRIPIILVFDDPPVEELHEAAALDPKRLSGRGLAKRLSQKSTRHDPFAGRSVRGYGAAYYFHFEVWKCRECPFKEGLDSFTSVERLVQRDVAIARIVDEQAQKG